MRNIAEGAIEVLHSAITQLQTPAAVQVSSAHRTGTFVLSGQSCLNKKVCIGWRQSVGVRGHMQITSLTCKKASVALGAHRLHSSCHTLRMEGMPSVLHHCTR